MSTSARSRAAGSALGLDAARSYGTVDEMLRAEAQRDDGIEAVAIMTPNDTHHPYAAAALDAGLDVIWDKPVAEVCPECGYVGAEMKSNKTRGDYRRCIKCANEWDAPEVQPEAVAV